MDQRNFMHPHQMHLANMHHLCKQHLNRCVRAELADGQAFEGIVEHVDEENVYLIIEININVNRTDEADEEDYRGFGYGYGYPPYGYGYPIYGYGYPGYSFGYGRLILPLAALTALTLLR